MSESIGLAFFAESQEEAEAQALEWVRREPHIAMVGLLEAKEIRPGRWDVFVAVVSTLPPPVDVLSLGL